ncbi:hypothetical protein ACTFIV_002695 [Dictyostelium citrinum]
MSKNKCPCKLKTIFSIILYFLFLGTVFATLYLSIDILVPSIKLSKGIETTSCHVTSTKDLTTCNNLKCVDQNTDIWWYNSWGSTYFFTYVSGGTANSDYNDDDDGGGNKGDSGDGGGGESDGGESDGGELDGDGDGGGGESDGGDGGDDEMKKSKISLLKAGLLGGSFSTSTSGSAEFNGYVPQEIKHKRLERKLEEKQQQLARSLKTATNSNNNYNNNNNNNNNNSSSEPDCNTCYQGIFYVTYTIGNGSEVESSIKGLVSLDYSWVSDYIGKFENGSYYTCYYQDSQPTNVVWFKPPKFNKLCLAGIIVFAVLSIIIIVVSIILFPSGGKKIRRHSGFYKPIASDPKLKKGSNQSNTVNEYYQNDQYTSQINI